MDRILNSPLSHSRLSKFEQCQLAFRFRYVDGLPERPGAAQVRGNVVHLALERMFGWEPAARTEARVKAELLPALETLLAEQPERAVAIDPNLPWPATSYPLSQSALVDFARSCEGFVTTYFSLEPQPDRLQPSHLEVELRHRLPNGFDLLGYIDRVETAPDGRIRITDYKTGKTPPPQYRDKPWQQLRTYAWLIWKNWGTVASELKLLYLTDGGQITYHPDQADLENLETNLVAISDGIADSVAAGFFPPRESKLCDFCSYQTMCPAKGGTPPPLPYEPSLGH